MHNSSNDIATQEATDFYNRHMSDYYNSNAYKSRIRAYAIADFINGLSFGFLTGTIIYTSILINL